MSLFVQHLVQFRGSLSIGNVHLEHQLTL